MKLRLLWIILSVFGLSQLTNAHAANRIEADAFMETMVEKVFTIINTDKQIQEGNVKHITKVLEKEFLPYIDFKRMTAASIGPKWREASAAEKTQVVEEFKNMLIRQYAHSVNMAKGVSVKILPLRSAERDLDNVTVKSNIITKDKNVNVNYRLRYANNKWLVYDVNIAGIWFVETYRQQFTPIINKNGVSGLIKAFQSQEFKLKDSQ